MSDPKRYDLVDKHYGYFLCHKIEGEWVKWEDYARLKAEVERLTTENESLQAKATNIYNAMVVRCKIEEITHKANADSIISQGMMSEAMKMMEESVAIREQVERLTKAEEMSGNNLKRCNCQECEDARKELRARIALKKGGQP